MLSRGVTTINKIRTYVILELWIVSEIEKTECGHGQRKCKTLNQGLTRYSL